MVMLLAVNSAIAIAEADALAVAVAVDVAIADRVTILFILSFPLLFLLLLPQQRRDLGDPGVTNNQPAIASFAHRAHTFWVCCWAARLPMTVPAGCFDFLMIADRRAMR